MGFFERLYSVIRSFFNANDQDSDVIIGDKRGRPHFEDDVIVEVPPHKRLRADLSSIPVYPHLTSSKMSSNISASSETSEECLLETAISTLARETAKSPRRKIEIKENIAVFDLTDDDFSGTQHSNGAFTTADSTNRGLRGVYEFNELPRTVRTQQLVIDLDEDFETTPENGLTRVNCSRRNLLGVNSEPELVNVGTIDIKGQFLPLKPQYKPDTKSEVSSALHERLQTHLKITGLTEELITSEKPVLTPEMLRSVHQAQDSALNQNRVLISKFKLNITGEDLLTLKNLNWLNDAVINFYLELIVERSKNKKYPQVYAFSTFFLSSLENGYDRVRRYTKNVDIFSKDMILVPIHQSCHWCMAKIDLKSKEIVYFDSMLGSNAPVLGMLMNYLVSEHRDKKNRDFDCRGWTSRHDVDIPTQRNGSDCGVFACTFAEYSARRSRFNFSQSDMPYMRSKMCSEIGFYESIFIHEKYACFRPFVPEFKGTTVLNILGLDITFLKLQDITKGYIKPCVMDVKIGSQTWDPNATESKRKTEDEKYQLSKKEFGFCIPGYQVYNLSSGSFNKMGKDQGRLLDKSTLPQALREFFNVNFSQSPFLIERFLQRLVAILDMWNSQKEVHIYSSSLLFAYDAHQLELFKTETSDLPCWMNIMMIDFAHVVPACNSLDTNYISGLTNLIKLLHEIKSRK